MPTPKSFDLGLSPPALDGGAVSANTSYTANSDSQDTTRGHLDVDHLSDSAYDGASESYDAAFFDLDPEVYFAEGNNCCGWVPNLTFVEDADVPTLDWRKTIASQNFSESLTDEGMQVTDAESSTSHEARETDYETAHLIQHFSQHISPFLDVFDAERYFGHVVPIKALQSSLLTNSLAAIAAKQFAKTSRENGNSSDSSLARLVLARDHPGSSIDWFYKAASFYDKAICQMLGLLQSLSDSDGRGSRSPTASRSIMDSRNNTPNSSASSPQIKRRRSEKKDALPNAATILDDLLAAVSVFLLYESLDNRQLETLNHMSGAQSLLSKNIPSNILNQRTTIRPGMLSRIDTSKAWQATFWNVARIDYIVAYTEATMPRLNTGDEQLWKAAGLPLVMVNGVLQPESICRNETSHDSIEMTEAVACKTLIWIVLRSLAYISAEKDNQNRTSDFNSTQNHLQTGPETWHYLRQLLSNWHDALPGTFQPFIALPRPQHFQAQQAQSPGHPTDRRTSAGTTVTIQFPTLCYSSAMASTAMVVYHFIQIYLLLHKPLARTSSESLARFTSKRMDAYRQTVQEIDYHASAVCGISLNRPIDAVQIHMAQPLHLAGLCFESAGQRVVLEGLLNGIQKTTGCSTEWIINSLRDEWGSNGLRTGIEPVSI